MSTLACFFKWLQERERQEEKNFIVEQIDSNDSLGWSLPIVHFPFNVTVLIASVIGCLEQSLGFIFVIWYSSDCEEIAANE
jgi:hypothetical protein